MAKSSAGARVVDALDYLEKPQGHPLAPVCAVFGDESYLKSAVVKAMRDQMSAGGGGEFAVTKLSGRETRFRDAVDALATVSLFGDGTRLVILEDADTFVTEHRSQLEAYFERPFQGGVLVLEVKSWPSNTRLAKCVAASGLAVECKALKPAQLRRWLNQCAAANGLRLEASAADAMLELLPHDLGVLEQEIKKLAVLVDAKQKVDLRLVRENVGGWRTRTIWELVDAAADGKAAVALAQLDRLILSGEKPHALLPQLSSSLRRFSLAVWQIEAAELDRRKLPLGDALVRAGVPPFKVAESERQLRRLGRGRAKELSRWLLAADLAIKSHNSSDERARLELERLIMRLA